jgi:general nucleoside transport system permease protein
MTVSGELLNKRVLKLLVPVFSIVLGMIGAGLIIAAIGVNPVEAYGRIFVGAFGTSNRIFSTLQRFSALAFAGLAVTIAFRAGIFNIGVEGQLYMGALFATWIGISFPFLPALVHIPLALLAGCIGGGLWAFIPGYLKATRGFNEIIISIFMNFIAIYLLGAAVNTFLKVPDQGIPWSPRILDSAQIPRIPGTTVHSGIILVFLIAFGIWYLLKHRTFGYEIRAVGLNRDAAVFGGINAKKVTIVTMVLSGVIGSFTGSMEILGIQHRLVEGFLLNYGYNAIPVALLGGLNPLGTLIVAFFYGALLNGASSMQIAMKIPVSIVQVIMALAILASIGMNGFQHIVRERRKKMRREC